VKANRSEVAEVLAAIDDPEAIERFLEDLLTPGERAAIEERWQIVKLLDQGHSQRRVRDLVACSVTTVTRGSRQLQHGTGGFRFALDVRAKIGEAKKRGAE
jgi:Trp operon repressor